ncbi:MAG: hypothetical protein KJ880_02125 [Candidatus Omnitrophica bacterium]|nr:hypothetical protein [Candidatus Omnitrophota bacterium]MBU1869283.1 hypothetical protein [Candidatus Omnitrophota bacterium]
MSSWQIVLLEPARIVLSQMGQFLMGLLLVLVILVIGWVISKVIKTVVTKVLRAIKLDELSDKIELDDVLAKGGISYSLSELIGVVCYWFSLLVFLMIAINAIGLTIAADLLNKVVLFVPHVIAAIFIMICGIFVGTILRNIVQTAASNAGLVQAKVLSKAAEIVIIVFAVFIALEQLNIGISISQMTISIVLGTIGLGLALAFGLGCKDIAARFVSEFLEKIKYKK